MGILNCWEDWEYETAVGRVETTEGVDMDALELSEADYAEGNYVPHWTVTEEEINRLRRNAAEDAAIELETQRMIEEYQGLR